MFTSKVSYDSATLYVFVEYAILSDYSNILGVYRELVLTSVALLFTSITVISDLGSIYLSV